MFEPNTTQTPNWFFLELEPLTMYQVKMLAVIIRKTYGWHKKKDLISNSQMADLTGIPRNKIKAVRQSLKDLLFIDFTETTGGRGITEYEILDRNPTQKEGVQKTDSLPFEGDIQTAPTVPENATVGGVEKGTGGGDKNGTTKDTNQKTLIKSNISEPPAEGFKELFQKFYETYKQRNNGTTWLSHTSGREGKALKQLITEYGAPMVLNKANVLLEKIVAKERFWIEQPYKPSTLLSLWDRIPVVREVKGHAIQGGKSSWYQNRFGEGATV